MLLSFHNDKKIKAKYLARIASHEKADEIIHGSYWSNGKGCAVGCTIHSGQHVAYETELGIPQMLAQLEDRIFEGMTNGHSKEWPRKFLEAIPVGVDLSKVGWKFQHWLLLDPKEGVIRFARKEDKKLFNEIGGLIWDLALGKMVNESAARSAAESAARSAASAAWSAAWSAAESAARSAESAARSAASAAWSAAESAASAAESAARSAESAAWSAAESAAYVRQGEKLLELLAEAK